MFFVWPFLYPLTHCISFKQSPDFSLSLLVTTSTSKSLIGSVQKPGFNANKCMYTCAVLDVKVRVKDASTKICYGLDF